MFGFLYLRQKPPAAAEVMRFQIRLPENVSFTTGGPFTLSPIWTAAIWRSPRSLPTARLESGFKTWMRSRRARCSTPLRAPIPAAFFLVPG